MNKIRALRRGALILFCLDACSEFFRNSRSVRNFGDSRNFRNYRTIETLGRRLKTLTTLKSVCRSNFPNGGNTSSRGEDLQNTTLRSPSRWLSYFGNQIQRWWGKERMQWGWQLQRRVRFVYSLFLKQRVIRFVREYRRDTRISTSVREQYSCLSMQYQW